MRLVSFIKNVDATAMKPIDPYSIDFSALRTLELVHAHGSFSRAAETLNVTQSSVSYTIERLRQALGDPLFVRQGGQMVSTQKCDDLVGQASMILSEFNRMTMPVDFDPATAQGTITIACNFYERAIILPHIIRVLRDKAPGLKLHVVSSFSQGRQRLSQGESDILLGPMKITEGGFFGRKILTDNYSVICAADNDLTLGDLTAESYSALPQIVVTYGAQWKSQFLIDMERMGLTPNAVLEVPSPAMIPELVQGTDLIATVPTRVAAALKGRVKHAACPIDAPFDVMAYWTERTHKSPMHKWLREQLSIIVSQLQ